MCPPPPPTSHDDLLVVSLASMCPPPPPTSRDDSWVVFSASMCPLSMSPAPRTMSATALQPLLSFNYSMSILQVPRLPRGG
jgi:hypothetical protein